MGMKYSAILLLLLMQVTDAQLPIPASTFSVTAKPSAAFVTATDWRSTVEERDRPAFVQMLPAPRSADRDTQDKTLSLEEAVVLSLRSNPDLRIAERERIIAKFNLGLAHHAYEPTWQWTVDANWMQQDHPRYNSALGVNWQSPIGTKVGLSLAPNTETSRGVGTATLNVSQPLIRGFGTAVNTIAWHNALDAENQSRLNFQSMIINQINAVVFAYRQWLADDQQQAVRARQYQQEIAQLRSLTAEYKAGRRPLNDVLQQKVNIQNTHLMQLDQQRQIIDDRQKLLAILGLSPSVTLALPQHRLKMEVPAIPSKAESIQLALEKNNQYQQLKLSIQAATRAVSQAKDQARWQLDLEGTVAWNGVKTRMDFPSDITGDNSFIVTQPKMPMSVGLHLSVPLDTVQIKQGIMQAVVNLQTATTRLQQFKDNLMRQVTNQWEILHNQQQRLRVAQSQLQYQQRVVQQSQLKYQYGRMTLFELNTLKNQWLQQQTSFIASQIGLLNQATTFEALLGVTLDKWHIQVRY